MKLLFSLSTLFIFQFVFANKTASEIYVDLEKAHSLKRVLYIAAHPDDENTKALAWFSLDEKAETAYMSLTRGDGGQNLIGNELSEDLGALRTQELLAARSLDHARQFFSRAVDFGYSKSADESFEKWGKEEILSDVVLVIRQFKPDVIITRFPPDKRAGHGHHTASAMLAIEAFEKAADPNYLPEQVKQFGTWKTTAIYWNTSVWWDDELSEKAKDDPNYLISDIGGYNPLLGKSYNEIGTLARSQHKCQGFGAIVERGSRIEYFQHLGGEKLKDSFFEQNNLSWDKLVSSEFDIAFNDLLQNFNFRELEKNIPSLLKLRKQLNTVPSTKLDAIRKEKITLLDQIITDCLGLYAEIIADDYAFVKNETFKITYNLTNRSGIAVKVKEFENLKENNILLPENKTIETEGNITNTVMLSTPYWLQSAFSNLFTVKDPNNLGRAESLPTFRKKITLTIQSETIEILLPVTYKWRDPSFGERRRNVISAPNFTANFDQKSVILKPGQDKTIRINIHAYKEKLTDEIKIMAPEGWKIEPAVIKINTTARHEEVWAEVNLKSTKESKRGVLKLTDSAGEPVKSVTEITYDHIPTQTIFKPAELACIAVNAEIIPGKVAYIKGAGDAVPEAIQQLGFDVSVFEVADLATISLDGYASIVLGIRIYNVHPELHNFDSKLYTYVSNGGNLIMQYNTASRSPEANKHGPHPFELSRNRVTEEDSEVKFLAPAHPIMTTPNKITQVDFENWVQERGLYFAGTWSSEFTPLFSWHDKGEEGLEGALIVAKHGKGQFIYTGISFFRELPNGVEGAYRLMANILSYRP